MVINQTQNLANLLRPMTLVIVSLGLRRVFRILHPILAIVANDLRSMGFYPVPN